MKTNKQLIFVRLLVTITLLIAFSVGSFGVNLIQYPLSTGSSSVPSGGTFSISSQLTSITAYGANGASATGWQNSSQYWEITPISTIGYHTITVSASMFSDVTGPAHFMVQYKIDGGSWQNSDAILLTSTAGTKTVVLPSACANKNSVAVRWITTDIEDTNGSTVLSDAKSYIKTIKITGNTPTTPDSQSNYISFVSITPTTITIDALPGNGSHRIIVINTEDNFVDPVDDQEYTANATYNTFFPATGQQVIYNGTGTEVTVTVPNSTNVYWVRYYDYDYNGGMTRYLIDPDVDNPNKCELETITLNSPIYHLVRANLGATIAQPKKNTIIERGIYWSTTPNVSVGNGHKLSDVVNADGVFSFDDLVTRGTTIYYKGYVKNSSGTIWTAESSFNNVPVFTGTGTWETAARWNVLEVPGANGDATYGNVADSPIINGICTLTADNNVTNLTINASKQLVISKATRMKVDGTLTNNAGTTGILIKSIDDKLDPSAIGSLVFANGSPQATVEMFSKASWNISNPEGNRFSWQYFGIPVTTLSYSGTFSNCYVREWDESVTNYFNVWVRRNNDESLQLASGSTLTSGLGYELVQQFNRKYNFAGTLVHSDFNKVLPYTTGARFAGQSILSNPYAAAIDITQLQFGANTEEAVYLYNTGTFKDWENANGEFTNGSGPGTYTVSTPGSVGLDGVPTQIPSMQGFLVKATANPGSISFAYSNLLKNSEKQRVKSTVQKTGTMIDLIGTKYGDRMWILDDANCSAAFDNGYDGRKMIGFSDVSQIYGMGADEIYQIMAVNDLTESYIGIQPGTETNFKLKFTHQNIDFKYSKLYLVDIVGNTTVDITNNGTEYSFISSPTDPVKRFKIVSGTTNNQNLESAQLLVSVLNGQVTLKNQTENSGKAVLFDATGRVLSKLELAGNENVVLPITLSKGLYVVRLSLNENIITRSIIVN